MRAFRHESITAVSTLFSPCIKRFCAAWVLLFPIRIPLRMRLQPQPMRRITSARRRGKFFPRTWNRCPRFAYSLSNLYGCTIKINWAITQNSVWPRVNDVIAICTCVKTKIASVLNETVGSVTTIVLDDHDFLLRASNFGYLAPFMAIWHLYCDFSYIFTAHAQKRLYVSFRLKFLYRHPIPWPRFPYGERYFGDLKTFSVDFCIRYVECAPYFYFRSTWPTDLESVSRVSPLATYPNPISNPDPRNSGPLE